MKTLNNLKPGQSGVVDRITAEGALKRHFLDMGITKGVVVTMERVAPFGDPVAVRLRGYSLSLRRAEAKKRIMSDVKMQKTAKLRKKYALSAR